ncbi:hypothetical protein OG909_08505 [Streptomyces sp. NBC_01754]|uniref:hypothetical protein n=1 Tax=Streptomyces sp. NBC_01754 TaxID=2975930 RepID=UPI002DDC4461|nr:hypothetical protein [Streptomyces sp. NBC_01754]WSC92332.1 hypothetical protein OG909_08505 [Streptomyces sp. NBC_01754]
MDDARAPVNRRFIAPCRSRSMSSMLSAPAAIPATSAITFAAGKEPVPFFEAGRRTRSATSPGSPHRSARRTSGASPPYAIRFGSSNRAETLAAAWEDCISEVPSWSCVLEA